MKIFDDRYTYNEEIYYMHENNLLTKIENNFKGLKKIFLSFYENEYLFYREKITSLDFSSQKEEVFEELCVLIDEYLIKIDELEEKYKISSRAKIRSSFLEEINIYLFKNLLLIRKGKFIISNKNIFAGLQIDNQMNVKIISKDVDFCIGQKVILKIHNFQCFIIIPIICVEVKTYLDGTMLNEIQFANQQIKNVVPNVKTYVLMEYNNVADEKIITAKNNNYINEMFVLRGKRQHNQLKNISIHTEVLLDYYREILTVLENINVKQDINNTGRLFNTLTTKFKYNN